MRVEHEGSTYKIEFSHEHFDAPIEVETLYRGVKPIKALTTCSISKVLGVLPDNSEDLEEVAYAESKCAVMDQFIKEDARVRSLKRAVSEIDNRELRGKLLFAYYARSIPPLIAQPSADATGTP